MFRRLRRVPWARLGGVLVVIGILVEYLDMLAGIDITPLVAVLGFDPGVVIASIGAVKITLRLVLMTAAAFKSDTG